MKKIISCLLVLIMLMANMCAYAGDTEDSRFAEEMAVIRDMKIMDAYQDGSMRPFSSVSRGEFAVMLMRLLGYGALSVNDGQEFDDVGKNYWAYNSIMLARSTGIISGGGSNRFMPDESVTLAQAVKMILCALGYETIATANGGWQTGYFTTATQVRLTKEITGDYDSAVTREQAAKLFYNALDVPIMTQELDGTLAKGETLFASRYESDEWVRAQGIVSADYYTSIMESIAPARDEVVIDGVLYKIGETDAAQFIGMKVEYYAYEDSEGNKRLLSVYPSSKNEVVETDSEMINVLTPSELVYYKTADANKETSVKFDNVKLIVNGQWINGFTQADLSIDEGSVRAIDNDGDGDFDILILNKRESFMVERVSQSGALVYLKQATYGGRRAVKLQSDDGEIHCIRALFCL